MAAVEDALYARLQAVSAVTSLVGTRIYPGGKKDVGPAVVWPYVTYTVVLSQRARAMNSDTGYVESSVRFDVWAKDASGSSGFDSAVAIAAAIRGALQRWRGTSATVVVDDIFDDGEFDLEDLEPGVYRRVIDFDVRWHE